MRSKCSKRYNIVKIALQIVTNCRYYNDILFITSVTLLSILTLTSLTMQSNKKSGTWDI